MSNAETSEMQKSEVQQSKLQESVVTPVDESQITDFLQSHPDFFNQNPALLNELEIPHQRGSAVSLVERQVASLRNENAELKRKLATFIQLAEDNDALLAKTKQLVLDLMAAKDERELKNCVESAIVESFNAAACLLWSLNADTRIIPAIEPEHASSQILGRLKERKRSYCGLLNEEDTALLFQQHADKVGSVAIIPLLKENEILGLLAIANQDPDYYRDNMSTGMLDFIGDALTLEMGRLVEA